VFHFAQKSWNYLFLQDPGAFSGIYQLRVDQRVWKHLPHRLQIEIDLRPMFGTRPPGLELEQGETARRGLDEAIDASTDDSSIDRHRERHLV
jgi:hypothetical protein